MAFSLLVNAASSRNRSALKTRIGILQVLPVLIRSVATPAGRKSLCTKSFRPAGVSAGLFFYRSPSARTIGRLMTIPETTHIERITSVMALLLAGLLDLTPQELPGLIRARGNPAGRKSLHGKTSGLRGIPQAHLSVTGVPAPERSDG